MSVDIVDGNEMCGRVLDGGGAITNCFGLDAGVAEAAVVHDGGR